MRSFAGSRTTSIARQVRTSALDPADPGHDWTVVQARQWRLFPWAPCGAFP